MSQFLQNANATAVSAKPQRRIDDILKSPKVIDSLRNLATDYMTPERMTSLAVTAINKTPKLRECNQASLLGCFAASFALGLEPNTPLGHAYLIPYKRSFKNHLGQWDHEFDCQFQIGYKGLVALLERTGVASYHFASSIRENDEFYHDMMRPEESSFKKAISNRGALVGAAFYMKRADGGHAMHVMDLEEIYKIRDCSETYRYLEKALKEAKASGNQKSIQKAEEKLADTPWVKWEDEMVAKSVLKRAVKMMDLIGDRRLKVASALDDASDMRRVNMAGVDINDGIDVALDNIGSAVGIAAESYDEESVEVLTDDKAEEAQTYANGFIRIISQKTDAEELAQVWRTNAPHVAKLSEQHPEIHKSVVAAYDAQINKLKGEQ